MKVSLKNITPDIETTIVEIARVSSSRKDKKENPEGLINYLIKNKHWSPFEHGFLTIEIETSKAIGIQLLRHRSFTFQEFSQRYQDISKLSNGNIVEFPELRRQAINNRQSSTEVFDPIINESFCMLSHSFEHKENYKASSIVDDAINCAIESYNKLLEAGVARECARMILPMATSTTIYMTGPVRSWIHMLDVRDDSHAQKEIQEIAKEIKQIFIENCPIISKARGYIQ